MARRIGDALHRRSCGSRRLRRWSTSRRNIRLKKSRKTIARHDIHCRYFSQEDLLGAGCLDIRMAMHAAEQKPCPRTPFCRVSCA
ncbi:MAG: hypothetical protein CMJ64_12200 [Planctomycetaceae bacterium]|nr:hypothetical protein [Planctomycetaceae bacterium]